MLCLGRMMHVNCSCWRDQQKRASWQANSPGSSSGCGKTEEFRLASAAPESTSSTTLQHSELVALTHTENNEGLYSFKPLSYFFWDDFSLPKVTWMTWTGYPTGLMYPPSRMCWEPESKLLVLWKRTSLSRTFTSSEYTHHCLSSHSTVFRCSRAVFPTSLAPDLWIAAHILDLFSWSNKVRCGSHWLLEKQQRSRSSVRGIKNGYVIFLQS